MNFTFSEEDLSGGNSIPEGDSEVVITKIEQGQSKAGAQQTTITMVDRYGREEKEFFPAAENMKWKIGKFAMAAGVSKEVLMGGGFTWPLLHGKKVLLVKKQNGVRTVKKGEETKEYKNFEKEYFLSNDAGTSSPAASASNDNIPF